MRIIKSIFLYIITFILALLLLLTGLIYIFEKGPSESIRNLFVVTVTQTSAAKFTAHMFLDDETVESIVNANTIDDSMSVSDSSLVTMEDETLDMDEITVKDVKGATFFGKMMIINDPSRVYVGCIPTFGVERGMKLSELCKYHDAYAGVNGGGFYDPGGQGKGGSPLGIVISQGKYLSSDMESVHRVIGFDNDNKLVVGTMTGREAIDRGVRDAVEWGPALIVNGEALDAGSSGGGYNPRTAIGQRADGAVILLLIDGRQPGSLGASYNDLIDIMLCEGAVNAANLDGGLSSTMYYDGEVINKGYSLYGERPIPTAVLVRR